MTPELRGAHYGSYHKSTSTVPEREGTEVGDTRESEGMSQGTGTSDAYASPCLARGLFVILLFVIITPPLADPSRHLALL